MSCVLLYCHRWYPIKVPIIMPGYVFRCTIFDLVSAILWSHICLVNLKGYLELAKAVVSPAPVAPPHKNIKRRCAPGSTPILCKILLYTRFIPYTHFFFLYSNFLFSQFNYFSVFMVTSRLGSTYFYFFL